MVGGDDEEHKSLISNNTWKFVDPSDSCNEIDCRQIFMRMLDAACNINRFKARFYVQGFGQRYGTDYEGVSIPCIADHSRVLQVGPMDDEGSDLLPHGFLFLDN